MAYYSYLQLRWVSGKMLYVHNDESIPSRTVSIRNLLSKIQCRQIFLLHPPPPHPRPLPKRKIPKCFSHISPHAIRGPPWPTSSNFLSSTPPHHQNLPQWERPWNFFQVPHPKSETSYGETPSLGATSKANCDSFLVQRRRHVSPYERQFFHGYVFHSSENPPWEQRARQAAIPLLSLDSRDAVRQWIRAHPNRACPKRQNDGIKMLFCGSRPFGNVFPNPTLFRHKRPPSVFLQIFTYFISFVHSYQSLPEYAFFLTESSLEDSNGVENRWSCRSAVFHH
jgi:hypothetical protein